MNAELRCAALGQSVGLPRKPNEPPFVPLGLFHELLAWAERQGRLAPMREGLTQRYIAAEAVCDYLDSISAQSVAHHDLFRAWQYHAFDRDKYPRPERTSPQTSPFRELVIAGEEAGWDGTENEPTLNAAREALSELEGTS